MLKPNSILILVCFFIYTGCKIADVKNVPEAGDNLGFEFVKDGIPANWMFLKSEFIAKKCPPNQAVPSYDFTSDSETAHEGKRSLKITVREIESNGYNHFYPSFFNEYVKVPGQKYRITFWVKSDGARFDAVASCVTINDPQPCPVTIVNGGGVLSGWTQYSIDKEICAGMPRLKVEIRPKTKGTLWFDDFKIEEIR